MKTTAVKERPVIFSGAMVRAILDGRKTQTRRVMKPQPIDGSDNPLVIPHPAYGGSAVVFRGPDGMDARPKEYQKPGTFVCRYGQPGDRLWGRESVRPSTIPGELGYRYAIEFRADGAKQERRGSLVRDLKKHGAWTPSIHMPRWASRITLELTEVRVQRLQEISEADARAEGVEWNEGPFRDGHTNHVSAFKSLWNSINGKRPGCDWQSNPWLWCLTFRRVESTS